MDGLRTALGRTACAAVALAAFAAVGGLAGPVPDGADDLVGAKLAELLPGVDAYDVLFVGTSRAYRHLDPQVFDERMAAAGHPTQSYNLGAPNMSFPELEHLLRRVLAAEPARLRWVVLDLSFPWQVDPRNFATRRVERWHDRRGLRTALTLALASDDPERLGLHGAWGHLARFARRAVRYGARVQRLAPASDRSPLEDHVRGFQALQQGLSTEHDARRTAFLAELPAYRARVERARGAIPPRVHPDPVHARLLARLVGELHGAGVAVLTYLPPVPRPMTWLASDGTGGPGDLHLELNDPLRHPELFEPERRFDDDHLDARGARTLTQVVAERLAR